jgi:predicted RNA-binding protein with PUA-like domain
MIIYIGAHRQKVKPVLLKQLHELGFKAFNGLTNYDERNAFLINLEDKEFFYTNNNLPDLKNPELKIGIREVVTLYQLGLDKEFILNKLRGTA